MNSYIDTYYIFDTITHECIGKVESLNKNTALEAARILFPAHPDVYARTANEFFC